MTEPTRDFSLWDLRNIQELVRTTHQLPAQEGEIVAFVHPSVIYGKSWRRVLRQQRRLIRRRVKRDVRKVEQLRRKWKKRYSVYLATAGLPWSRELRAGLIFSRYGREMAQWRYRN